MVQSEFKKILFQAAFTVMACDGEIHDSEISVIEKMVENSIYFDGINYNEELNKHISHFKTKGGEAVKAFFNLLSKTELDMIEEEHLINVLLKVVEADEKIDDSELHFLHNVRQHLNISDTSIIIKFPKHINLLVNISSQENQNVKPGLDSIDFTSAEKLFVE